VATVKSLAGSRRQSAQHQALVAMRGDAAANGLGCPHHPRRFMCGFVLVFGRNGRVPRPFMIERMTASLAHRGPDDSGFWYSGAVAMGFRRLAIIDTTTAGHQPMVSPDGETVLVFNGEIYNYVELRAELRSLGHHFRSSCDSEVLLAAYRQWGDRVVDRLVGMFAFAIWDRKRGEVFGARDRFGIKPLFVYHGVDIVILASEIKAIHASGESAHAENWHSIARYLVDGKLDDSSATCFAGIEQVAAANTFRLGAAGPLRQQRYFDWPTSILERADEAPRVVGEMFEESIRLQTRSDVPVGVCLSGGVDSTSILCGIARLRRSIGDTSPILAFSYNAPEFDESRYVAETIRETGATLVSLDTDVRATWANLPRVLHFHDEPLHSMTALVGFQLMGLARRHGALVILNGQGADETLAGYNNYHLAHWVTLVLQGRVRQAMLEIDGYARAFGANSRGLATQVLRIVMFRAMRLLPGYAPAARMRREAASRDNQWVTPEVARKIPDRGLVPSARLDDIQRDAVTSSPLPLYLRIEDRNSMSHGVEMRVPFLDHRLAEYALSLPLEWRMRGPWNKYALREAMRGKMPEVVRTRQDKMGFPTPVAKWFGAELHEPLRALLDTRASRTRGLFQTDNLLRELDAGRGTDVANSSILFRAANVEAWLSMLADRRAERELTVRPVVIRDSKPVFAERRIERVSDGARRIALTSETGSEPTKEPRSVRTDHSMLSIEPPPVTRPTPPGRRASP
jgi:asparagine synthase (glutamine-hydrolysing)